MNTKQTYNRILSEQGCLTQEGIAKYLSGELARHEMDLVHDHIKKCNLCREAVQGAGLFADPDQYKRGIDMLRSRWALKTAAGRRISNVVLTAGLAVAASVVLIIGVYFFSGKRTGIHSPYLSVGVDVGSAALDLLDNPDIALIPVEESSDRDEQEDATRKKFRKENPGLQQETIPLALMEDTRIAAGPSDTSSGTESKSSQIRKGYLRYPYRVMSMPPPENEIEDDKQYAHEELFTIVEEMPQFRTDDFQNFGEYLQMNLRYPLSALEKQISGRVYVQFTVDEHGQATDSKILKSIHPVLDGEVLRVINGSPLWIPGKQRGESVKVTMVMPVDFVLF